MDWTLIFALGYVWVLFCGWAKERGHFGPEFWVAAASPILAIVAFFIAFLFNLLAPPSTVADPLLLLFYLYFLLPIPGMTWITAALGWRPRPQEEIPPVRTRQEVGEPVPPVQEEQGPPLRSKPSATVLSTQKRVVLPGKGRATDVAFSRSGDMLAVASPPGVYLYVSDDLLKTAMIETDQSICCVAVSTASGLVAAGDIQGRLHLWRLGHSDPWKTFEDLYVTDVATRLAFSADGRMLAYGGGRRIRVWDLDTEDLLIIDAELPIIGDGQIRGLSFTEDGRFLIWELQLWAGLNECHIWNMVTRKLHPLPDGTVAVAFPIYAQFHVSQEPSNRGLRDEGIELRHLRTDQVLATLTLKALGIRKVTRQIILSPRGDRLAAVTKEGQVWVWAWTKDASAGRELIDPEHGYYNVKSLAFSCDSQKLAIGGEEVMIWDPDTGRRTFKLICYGKPISSLSFSHDDRLMSSRGNYTHLWNLQDGRELLLEMGHASEIRTIAFSPDADTLACAGDYGEIQLWDVDTGKRLRAYKKEYDIKTLGYSSDGTLLAVRDMGKADRTTLQLWDVVRDRAAESVSECEPLVLFAQLHGGTVRLWDTLQVRIVAKPRVEVAHETVVSPDGTRLAVMASDIIELLRIDRENVIIPEMTLHNDRPSRALYSLGFSTDGQFLAAGGDYEELWLWDLNLGASEPRVFRSEKMLECYALCFSSGGRYLVSGGRFSSRHGRDNGFVELWDIQTGQSMGTFAGHRQSVQCVTLSSDGRFLASGSKDGTVRLWEVGLSEPVGQGPVRSQY
jgi:WD40 repeat protein